MGDTPDDPSDDMAQLIAHSDVIVIGTITDEEHRSKSFQNPDPNVVASVGKVYGVQVERYLKGSGGETLSVIQFTGLDYTNQSGDLVPARNTDKNLFPSEASRYMLFLQPHDQDPNLMIGTVHPHKFLLSSGRAKAESPVGDMDGTFPELSEAEFISRIETVVDGG